MRATAAETSLKKWNQVLSTSMANIPARLLCKMQANCSRVEFLRTIFKFIKKKKIFSSIVHVLQKRKKEKLKKIAGKRRVLAVNALLLSLTALAATFQCCGFLLSLLMIQSIR